MANITIIVELLEQGDIAGEIGGRAAVAYAARPSLAPPRRLYLLLPLVRSKSSA
jgi:hypothetical protein